MDLIQRLTQAILNDFPIDNHVNAGAVFVISDRICVKVSTSCYYNRADIKDEFNNLKRIKNDFPLVKFPEAYEVHEYMTAEELLQIGNPPSGSKFDNFLYKITNEKPNQKIFFLEMEYFSGEKWDRLNPVNKIRYSDKVIEQIRQLYSYGINKQDLLGCEIICQDDEVRFVDAQGIAFTNFFTNIRGKNFLYDSLIDEAQKYSRKRKLLKFM